MVAFVFYGKELSFMGKKNSVEKVGSVGIQTDKHINGQINQQTEKQTRQKLYVPLSMRGHKNLVT